jgi:hypothetical protein
MKEYFFQISRGKSGKTWKKKPIWSTPATSLQEAWRKFNKSIDDIYFIPDGYWTRCVDKNGNIIKE